MKEARLRGTFYVVAGKVSAYSTGSPDLEFDGFPNTNNVKFARSNVPIATDECINEGNVL